MLSPSKSEPIAARVVVLCAAYALCVLLQRTAETTTLSLFVQQLGASKLPMSYLAMSLFDVPMAFGYMRLARTANRRSLLSGMAATLVAVLGAAYVLEPVHPGAGLFVGYLAASTIGTFLAIHWGVLLLDAFTVEESRRAFPLVYAGGHAGSFASGAVLQQLAGPVPSATLMVAVPAAALVMLAALLALVGRMREGAAVREGDVPRPGSAAGASAWAASACCEARSCCRSSRWRRRSWCCFDWRCAGCTARPSSSRFRHRTSSRDFSAATR